MLLRSAAIKYFYSTHLITFMLKTMYVLKAVFIFMTFHALNIFVSGDGSCDDIMCSNVYDPVCGVATALKDKAFIKIYQNICYLTMIQCLFPFAKIELIPQEICNIKKTYIDVAYSGRRLQDFSIVGAHQTCNHTCPTYCLDIYEPACAQIWTRDMQSYVYKPMINHCHIDLYSCVMGVNVTIQPLIGKCYKNPSALNFMFNVASLKTLKLLDEPPPVDLKGKHTRRMNLNFIVHKEMQDFIKRLGKRLREE